MNLSLKCSQEAREKCPFPRTCERDEDAYFEEGSPCHAFNLKIMRPPPKTNADHIRSMTDEELVDYLAPTFSCYGCPARNYCEKDEAGTDCNELVANWLKQPYGGGT